MSPKSYPPVPLVYIPSNIPVGAHPATYQHQLTSLRRQHSSKDTLHKIQSRSSLDNIQPPGNIKAEVTQISTLARHQRARGPHREAGRHSSNLRCAGVSLLELSRSCWRSYTRHSGLFLRNLRSHKGGRRDLLASAGPTSGVQEGGPVSCCACRAGIGVSAHQLQHAGRRPVVEGQLPGAVAAHPDPHGPQQHGHARHAPVGRGRHGHIVVGLRL